MVSQSLILLLRQSTFFANKREEWIMLILSVEVSFGWFPAISNSPVYSSGEQAEVEE